MATKPSPYLGASGGLRSEGEEGGGGGGTLARVRVEGSSVTLNGLRHILFLRVELHRTDDAIGARLQPESKRKLVQ